MLTVHLPGFAGVGGGEVLLDVVVVD